MEKEDLVVYFKNTSKEKKYIKSVEIPIIVRFHSKPLTRLKKPAKVR